MRKKIPSTVIETISNNYSSYFDDLYLNYTYNLHINRTIDLGTMFYTDSMKTINLLSNDYITDNSFDCYA